MKNLLAAAALLIHPVTTLQTVGIVGAGPAGLTLAVALNRALPDVAVTVFDRSDSCRPALGGGVQLNSGAAVLARLDPALGAAVAALGQPVRGVRSRTAGGDALLDLDLAAAIRGNARARERGLVDADGEVRAYTIMRDALQATPLESTIGLVDRERLCRRLEVPSVIAIPRIEIRGSTHPTRRGLDGRGQR